MVLVSPPSDMDVTDEHISWADVYDSDSEDDNNNNNHDHDHPPEDASPLPSPGVCDYLMGCFPVPGEIWCHLFTTANYYTSVLQNHPPPPRPRDPPVIVNHSRHQRACHTSPFRIHYGTRNPALHGVVLTDNSLVPHFSWTPRLCITPQQAEVLTDPRQEWPPPVILVPAVHGRVVRLFAHRGVWYAACRQRVEALPQHLGGGNDDDDHSSDDATPALRASESYAAVMLGVCLARYRVHSLARFVRDLDPRRVWFFACYPARQALLFLGTCRQLSHAAVQQDPHLQQDQDVDLDFSVHGTLPAAVPILPAALPHNTLAKFACEALHSPSGLQYTDLYDGVLLLNTRTMFAVRLSYPRMVFLAPLLRHRLNLQEFLALRILEARLVDCNHPHLDTATLAWVHGLPQMTYDLFYERHAASIARMEWQADTILDWLPVWMDHIGSLCPEEWTDLDPELQRLYLLLDYEHPGQWFQRILCNRKYGPHVAKLLVFCARQQAWISGVPP